MHVWSGIHRQSVTLQMLFHLACFPGLIGVSYAQALTFDERIEQASTICLNQSLILLWSYSDPIHPLVSKSIDCGTSKHRTIEHHLQHITYNLSLHLPSCTLYFSCLLACPALDNIHALYIWQQLNPTKVNFRSPWVQLHQCSSKLSKWVQLHQCSSKLSKWGADFCWSSCTA